MSNTIPLIVSKQTDYATNFFRPVSSGEEDAMEEAGPSECRVSPTGCLIFVAFLGLGVVFYVKVEDLSFVDSLYFCIITLTTVGYSSFESKQPIKDGTKIFSCFFIMTSLFLVATVLSNIISALLEKQGHTLLKASSLLEEKKGKTHINGFARTLTELEIGQTLEKAKEKRVLGPLGRCIFNCCGLGKTGYNPITITQRFFVLMWSAFVVIVMVVLGVAVFMSAESQRPTLVDAIYFIVVSIATVGYGDYAPDNDTLKVFFIVYLPLSTLSLARLVGDIVSFLVERKQKIEQCKILNRKVNASWFKRLDVDNDGEIDKFEFLSTMLIEQGVVERETIDRIMKRFAQLDVDHDGTIDTIEQ